MSLSAVLEYQPATKPQTRIRIVDSVKMDACWCKQPQETVEPVSVCDSKTARLLLLARKIGCT